MNVIFWSFRQCKSYKAFLRLLDLEFEDFVRVGSVKKIAKQVLPYSVHTSGTDNQELRELQSMLKSDLSAHERTYVIKPFLIFSEITSEYGQSSTYFYIMMELSRYLIHEPYIICLSNIVIQGFLL